MTTGGRLGIGGGGEDGGQAIGGGLRAGRSPRQVVVTGVGATTPLGGDARSTWAAMLSGRCGVRRLRDGWAADLPVRIAARAAVEPPEMPPDATPLLRRATASAPLPHVGRADAFLMAAVGEAWRDAGFASSAGHPGGPPADRVAVCVGTGVGGAAALLAGGGAAFPALLLGSAATEASRAVGAGAGAHAIGGACAAGAEAIAFALAAIRAGRADVVVAGGTEAAIHPLTIAAFARMSALSQRNDEPHRACRPYDKGRDGFVLGEGAGVLVLESADHAASRGATVYCELAGSGLSADARHITQPDPGGWGMSRAVRAALRDGGLSPADVVHVNPHATASSRGDVAEARALAGALGADGYCVSATKSMTGHLIGAAGAVEAVATVLALRDRMAPPTINCDDLDDDIGLDIVRWGPRPLTTRPAVAVSTSAAFGGHNVALAFRADAAASVSPGSG